MHWKHRVLVLVGMLLICTTAAHLRRDMVFTDLAQAENTLKGAGYHCVGDRADGRTINSFVVSRKPIGWEEANALRRAGPLGPEWNGRAWVTVPSAKFKLSTTPGEAPPRSWGGIIAFGDQALLDEIERDVRL